MPSCIMFASRLHHVCIKVASCLHHDATGPLMQLVLHLAWEAVASESFAHEAMKTNWMQENGLRSEKDAQENKWGAKPSAAQTPANPGRNVLRHMC